MLLSVPFIIATIAVYIFLPQLLNVIGKCLICYLSNLGCLYIILAAVQIKGINDYIEELPCILLGYTTYFLQRSAFAWASVIGFDLCLNFRQNLQTINIHLYYENIIFISCFEGTLQKLKGCQRKRNFGSMPCILTFCLRC